MTDESTERTGSGRPGLPSIDRRLDAACERFESAWREGRRPRIEDHLAEVPEAEHEALLGELILLEVELRRGAGESPTPEEYDRRFPGRAGPILRGPHFAVPGDPGPRGGRFRVLRFLAEGGLGAIYVARDEELGRDVALKTIKDPYADDPDSRGRFLLEAEVTGGLEHPGVVPVYGLSRGGDRPYYAMRLIEGESLKEALARFHRGGPGSDPGGRSMGLRLLLRRFVDVCNAVAYAHSRGVLHRDLKPGNVMLGPYGETLVVDWGLAKVTGRDDVRTGGGPDRTAWRPGPSSGPSPTRGAVGTPQYMSPEQAAADPAIGPGSDVYSLGAILYGILAGRAPIEKGDPEAMLARVARGEFPGPRQVEPSAPPALEAVCLKAMALRPEDRYETPRDLADEVERWLADVSVRAYRDPWATRARRWMGRHRTAVAASVASVVLAVPGLAGFAAYQNLMVGRLEAANARAVGRFSLARDAVRGYHQGVAEDVILRRKALSGLRDRLLGSARDFYRALADDLAAGPAARETAGGLAEALVDLAGVTAQIGDKRAALATYARALDLLRAGGPGPDGDEATQGLAAAIRRGMAEARQDLGELGPARSDFEEARRLLVRMTAKAPGDRAARASLADAETGLGDVLRASDEPDRAREAYLRALAIRQGLAGPGGSPADRRGLAETLGTLGTLDYASGQVDRGIAQIRRGCDLQKALRAGGVVDDELRGSLGKGLFNLGLAEQAAGRIDPARRALLEALEVRRGLADDHPVEPEFRGVVALTLMYLGLCDLADTRPAEAAASLVEALSIQRPLAEAHPELVQARSDLSATLDNLGTARRALKDLEGADRAFAEALKLREALVAESPSMAVFRSDLADTLGNLARLRIAAGRGPETLPMLRRSVAIRRELTIFGAIMLYNIACETALMVPMLTPPEADAAVDEATGALLAAARGGYRNLSQVETDLTEALAPIRDRPEVRGLLEELRRESTRP